MKVSVVFYPNKSKRNVATGKTPMYLRITFNGTKAEARINADVSDKDIANWNPFTMRFNDRNFDVNHQLNNIDQEFRKFLMLNETRLTQYSAGFIRDFVLGKRISPDKIFREYVESYYINSILPNKELARGTKKNYRKALNHLSNFISFTKSQHLRLKDLDGSFAHRFKDYLLKEYPEKMKKGMTEVAASGNLKKIITIVERASNEGLFKEIHLKP
jgi:hypothetical protein